MTLVTRLRAAFLSAVAAASTFAYLVTMYDPALSPQWVLSAVFASAFTAVAGMLCFFGFRIRMRFAESAYSEEIWRVSLRQALLGSLAMVVVLGLAAGRIASPINLFFLFAFILSLEMAARRRRHVEVVD